MPDDGARPGGSARPGARRVAGAVRSALVATAAVLGVAGMIAVTFLFKGLVVVALIGLGIYLGDVVAGADGRTIGGGIGCVVALVLYLVFDGPRTSGGSGGTGQQP